MGKRSRERRKQVLAARMRRMDAVEALGRDPKPHPHDLPACDAWNARERARRDQYAALLSEYGQISFGQNKRQFRQQAVLVRTLPEKPPMLRKPVVANRALSCHVDPKVEELRRFVEANRDHGAILEIAEYVLAVYQDLEDPERADIFVLPFLYGPRGLTEWHARAKRHFVEIHHRQARWRKNAHTKYRQFYITKVRMDQVDAERSTYERTRLTYTDFCRCWMCQNASSFDIDSGIYMGRTR